MAQSGKHLCKALNIPSRAGRLPYSSRRGQRFLVPSSYASYHSSTFPDPEPFPPTQSAILTQALSHVPTHGFTDKSLLLGARDAGYLDVTVQLFPRGAYDLVNYYRVTRRLALKDRVQFDDEKSKLGVGKKVRVLALERLRMNVEDGIVNQLQKVTSIDVVQPI